MGYKIMSSSDEEIVLALVCDDYEKRKKRKRREYWVHSIFRARLEEGEFHTLFKRLMNDEKKFYKYFRMSPGKFNILLEIVAVNLQKQNSRFRQCIGPRERLTVFLR